MAQGQQHKNKAVKTVVIYGQDTVTEDDIGPPPLNLTSQFKTLHDWLVNICNSNKPKKAITKYNVDLFESTNDYTLCLTGVNTYVKGDDSFVKIEYTPQNLYYRLPVSFHKGINRQQVLMKLMLELEDFTTTIEFKNSFFTRSNAIVFLPNGKKIWPK
ncbi:hypothetical protein GCM10011425_27680 [Mucilaginibacter galii]|uniref:Uncharacterized protein n=2 Tax=Mucilaginibacter galii TaxID=2005073 RepID=A0A917JAC7_9SPHI|nr:hypothetical protein GCM10011425_27680 [Mucilaginibacter galii]